MKAFNGYKAEAKSKGYPQLPAGPYVAKIMAVKLEGFEPEQLHAGFHPGGSAGRAAMYGGMRRLSVSA